VCNTGGGFDLRYANHVNMMIDQGKIKYAEGFPINMSCFYIHYGLPLV
jgi:hypothetical protein